MFGMWRLKHRLKQVEKKFEKALKKLDGKKQEPYEYQELIADAKELVERYGAKLLK